MTGITNATKANVIAALNAGLGLAIAFGVNLTDIQVASILGFGNAFGVLLIGFTYRDSAKRVPDDGFVLTLDPDQE